MPKSAKEVRKMLEDREKSREGRGKDMWFPGLKQGFTVLRLGQPWAGDDGDFWKDRFFHGGYKNKVFCAKNEIDKETGKPRKCKVCRAYKALKGDQSSFARRLSKLIFQRSESLWNVVAAKFKERHGKIEVTGVDDPKKFQILQMSYKWTQDLQDIFGEEEYREKSELGVTDPKVGMWIRVRRRGKEMDTKYDFKVLDNPCPISEDKSERKEIEKTLIDLDAVVKGSSDEELEAFLEKMTHKAKKGKGSDSGSSDDKHKSSSSGSSDDKKKSSSSSSDDKKSNSKKSSSSSEDKTAKEVYKEMKKSLEKGSKKKGSSSDDKKKGSDDKKKKDSSDDKKKSSSSDSSDDKKKSSDDSGS